MLALDFVLLVSSSWFDDALLATIAIRAKERASKFLAFSCSIFPRRPAAPNTRLLPRVVVVDMTGERHTSSCSFVLAARSTSGRADAVCTMEADCNCDCEGAAGVGMGVGAVADASEGSSVASGGGDDVTTCLSSGTGFGEGDVVDGSDDDDCEVVAANAAACS
mmetsp:Transcript_98480/g.205385  ORF Transcript_98480/g.205385 Transcript_98480/m.205385 type:complete len:164 (-) Transcript_98480:710-1201(-)